MSCSRPSRVDLHVHSDCSVDGMSSIADYARQAARLELAEVGLCEHADFDPRDPTCGFLDPARYDREIEVVRTAAPPLCLRQGVEINFQRAWASAIRDWLSTRHWDFVVASVHLVEDEAKNWAILSEPGPAAAWFSVRSERQAYEPYFAELLGAAQSGLADILGHLDIVKRYGMAVFGPFRPEVFAEEIREVLRAAVESGVGLEINSSGWRQAPGEPYPGLTILSWYRELGGERLTVGSDAHRMSDLGNGTAEACELAREAGFRYIASFEARQPVWHRL